MAARELLTESGSCFVQIGDENVHRVRALMDEVFGEENFVSSLLSEKLADFLKYRRKNKVSSRGFWFSGSDILWYAKDAD